MFFDITFEQNNKGEEMGYKPKIIANSWGKKRVPGCKSLESVLKCDDKPFIDFI